MTKIMINKPLRAYNTAGELILFILPDGEVIGIALFQPHELEKSRTVQNVNAQKFRLSGEAFCGLPIHGG
jgi:hypothetical protein